LSNLSGIWYFDSRPLLDSDEMWVLRGLGEPIDAPSRFQRGPGLLMGLRASCFDAANDDGYAAAPDGSICTWDGRLDNRRDLRLRLLSDTHASSSDSGLALGLYQLHGPDGLHDLIGDWSMVLADARSRIVLLASDYAGTRPLYYCRTGESLMWSSSLDHLVQWTGRDQLDEEYVASFLTKGWAAHSTPYRGLYPVPPGRAVCVTTHGISTRAFWDLPAGKATLYTNPETYVEQLRSLFREAVAVRLPSNTPACAELSGGLDSSSIVCMADVIAKESAGGPRNPTTFTYTHQGSSDEQYVKVIEGTRNLTSIRLDLEEYPFVGLDQPGNATPSWWCPRFAELKRQFADLKCGTFLTGQLGDFIMGNLLDDLEQAVDYLREGHWLRAAQETYAWSQSLGIPIYPLFWRALRTAYSPWTASIESGNSHGVPSKYARVNSLAPAFLERVLLNRAERLPERSWRQARASRRSRFKALSEILDSRSLQAPEALQHISYSHPFAHRPLVEFMLTIPPGEVCRPGEPRWLMRRAFKEFLPSPILQRRSKATYTQVYRQALIPLATKMHSQPDQIRLVAHGYVDRISLEERLARYLQGLDCNEPQLRQLLLFEFWLRKREGSVTSRGRSAAPTLPDLGNSARKPELATRAETAG
jgi:asparagine synthase (glutamine-hydrolysing)